MKQTEAKMKRTYSIHVRDVLKFPSRLFIITSSCKRGIKWSEKMDSYNAPIS